MSSAMSSGAAPAAPLAAASVRRTAILCVLGSGLAFAVAAALIKSTGSGGIPVSEMVVFRSAIIALVMVVMLRRKGGVLAALRTRHPGRHALRTLFGFVAMYTSFVGYLRLPLAVVTALGFAMPLCLTLLSAPLLGETIGWRRGGAVLVGLAGVLIVVRPWQAASAAMPLSVVLLVLGGVVCWSLTMITIRKLGSAGEANATIVLWYCLGSLALSAALAAPVWVTPTGREAGLLVAAGLVTAAAQLLMTQAYRSGEATLVAPFEYGAILHATLFGALLWGESPDAWSVAGIAVLIGAGLYVWRREVALTAVAARAPG